MRLRAWVKQAGRGSLRQLATQTGLAYGTVLNIANEKNPADGVTALAIHRATDGAVSVAELVVLPPRAAAEHQRRLARERRRRRRATAQAA